jgi:hypothetical protein
MNLILGLLKVLGLEDFAQSAVLIGRVVWWVVRVLRVVLVGLLAVALWKLEWARRIAALGIAALWLLFVVLRAVWVRRKRNAVVGERTIDGKVVPDKLAAAALGVPARSPDGEYVLRGLPDYGKALLKLDAGNFAYEPEAEPAEPERALEEPAVNRAWLARLPRWSVAGVAALLLVAGVSIYIHRPRQHPATERWSGWDAFPKARVAEGGSASTLKAAPPIEPEANAETVQAAGLVWAATDNGQAVDFQEAAEYCATLTLDGRAWRLPKMQELSDLWAEKMVELPPVPGFELLKNPTLGHGFRLTRDPRDVKLWSTDVDEQTTLTLKETYGYVLVAGDSAGGSRQSWRLKTKDSQFRAEFRALCVSQ